MTAFSRSSSKLPDLDVLGVVTPEQRAAFAAATASLEEVRVVARATEGDLRQDDLLVLTWCNRSRLILNQICRHTRGEVPGSAPRDGSFDAQNCHPHWWEPVAVFGNGARHGLRAGDREWLDDELRLGDTIVTLFQVTESCGSAGGAVDGLVLSFGYAMTVSQAKAQGIKRRSILIYDECPKGDPQREGWLFAAISCASERVTLVNRCCC